MQTIRKILSEKGSAVWNTTPGATVYEALQLMADKDVGALPVMEGDRLVGIFSERDYARKVILHGKASRDTQVREIMTSRVVYIPPSMTVEEGLALMTDKRIRHLPVMEGGRLIGLVSIGDLVKAKISEQEFIIDQLERYITR